MNLAKLRDGLKNQLDYSPELQTFNDQMDSLINDAYYNLWTEKRWNFAQKTKRFKFIPDILPTRDVVAPNTLVTALVTKGDRLVTFSAPMDRLTATNFEGGIFDIGNYEYVISKVVTSDSILLDQPYIGTTSNSASNWEIKKRYYSLPEDCTELLSLSHRDNPSSIGSGALPPYGKLRAIPARKDEELNLRTDYKAAYAEAFVWSSPVNILPGETLGVETISLEGNNGFPVSSYLEVCWAFIKDGKLGALSEPKTAIFAAQNSGTWSLKINFLSWDNQLIQADSYQSHDRFPTQYEGYTKVIFWNANFNRTTGERLGLPAWKFFNTGGATRNANGYLNPITAPDTASSVTVTTFNSIDSGNFRYIEVDGQHFMIRPYPRVDSWDVAVTQQASTASYDKVPQDFLREGEMRYLYKPPSLAEITDVPHMPSEFHQLIIYKSLEEVYMKLGNVTMAETYRVRTDKKLKEFEKRYVDHIDSHIVRGRFSIGAYDGFAPYDYTSLRKLS